jgi:hypothetical protein
MKRTKKLTRKQRAQKRELRQLLTFGPLVVAGVCAFLFIVRGADYRAYLNY